MAEQTNPNKLPVLLSLLEDGQVTPITPIGSSMCPFFLGGRDTLYVCKAVFPLKKGDIALYQRKDGTYIVHRVHHIKKSAGEDLYFFLGDNQTWIEGPITQDHIYGVTAYFIRKGKKIDCTSSWKYNLLWRLWMVARPVRPVLSKQISICRRILRGKNHFDS